MPEKNGKAKAFPRDSRSWRPAGSSLEDAPTGKLTLQRGEPADCFVTGASRSLQRRLMGLNITTTTAAPAVIEKVKKRVAKSGVRPTATHISHARA